MEVATGMGLYEIILVAAALVVFAAILVTAAVLYAAFAKEKRKKDD